MFAQIYICKNCGENWKNIEEVEVIDTENDDVYSVYICEKCGREVTEKLTDDGKPVFHAFTADEMREEVYWQGFDSE